MSSSQLDPRDPLNAAAGLCLGCEAHLTVEHPLYKRTITKGATA